MKKLFLISLFATFLLFASAGSADEIVFNVGSHHINSAIEYNEQNYGIGYRDTDNNIEYGIYQNSYYDLLDSQANGTGYSVYIKGSAWAHTINKFVKLNLDFGAAWYGKDGPIPILPIVQPMVILTPLKHVHINLGYMPLIQETMHYDGELKETKASTMYGVLTLSVSYAY